MLERFSPGAHQPVRAPSPPMATCPVNVLLCRISPQPSPRFTMHGHPRIPLLRGAPGHVDTGTLHTCAANFPCRRGPERMALGQS